MELKDIKQVAKSKAFDCDILRFSHLSPTLGNLETKWHAILPRVDGSSMPVLYFLSGLTCSDENFIQKAGAARAAAEHRVIIVACDTSPRGAGAEGEDDSWDFGTGAGFYVDATQAPFTTHYRMYSFISDELPVAVSQALGARVDVTRAGVFGHSMGGMGALVQALRRPNVYKSVSAFAPIAHPSACPWGEKCFGGYLGNDAESRKKWVQYDPTELVRSGSRAPGPILIDQGDSDVFLAQGQLLPEHFKKACEEAGQEVTVRVQKGYGHDYFFIQTFVADHVAWHAQYVHGQA